MHISVVSVGVLLHVLLCVRPCACAAITPSLSASVAPRFSVPSRGSAVPLGALLNWKLRF